MVNDYIVRIERQKRGMPHAHMLLWSAEGKRQCGGNTQAEKHKFGNNDEAKSDDDMPAPKNIPQVYDKYVRTTAPERWCEAYQNPNMEELSEKTRRNHSAYCVFRVTGACRFGGTAAWVFSWSPPQGSQRSLPSSGVA